MWFAWFVSRLMPGKKGYDGAKVNDILRREFGSTNFKRIVIWNSGRRFDGPRSWCMAT